MNKRIVALAFAASLRRLGFETYRNDRGPNVWMIDQNIMMWVTNIVQDKQVLR